MALNVLTWNIAAVNNNPFEYWVTYEDPAYNDLMEGVQTFMDNPGALDVPVSQVLGEKMAQELFTMMEKEGWAGVDETRAQWETDYSRRKMVAGFMQDKQIGAKRLASMPDRITNTINTVDGAQVCRPTLINMYEEKLDSVEDWWGKWKEFMFSTEITIKAKTGVDTKRPCQMLDPISSTKYPALSPEEEAISIPLQTLCQAIFDAILVHIVNTLAPGKWHDIKMSLCNALVKNKDAITLKLLQDAYSGTEVVFLQEVAGVFIDRAAATLGDKYHLLAPAKLDSKRDQNSMILLSKTRFNKDSVKELTADLCAGFEAGTPVADGDMFAVTVEDVEGVKYLLASFHGDTNGLATIPVVRAVKAMHAAIGTEFKLIFGLDANTHVKGVAGKVQGMQEFVDFYTSEGLTSCWGNNPDPAKILTTFNARTFLQPQLNKAIRKDEKAEKGDVNPKDFILFMDVQFRATSVAKDNTGKHEYVEDMVFPTLEFPSDHGILSATIEPVAHSSKTEL